MLAHLYCIDPGDCRWADCVLSHGCRQQVAAVMLSLEDELAVLDLRYADLLQSVQKLSGCDDDDAEVSLCFIVIAVAQFMYCSLLALQLVVTLTVAASQCTSHAVVLALKRECAQH